MVDNSVTDASLKELASLEACISVDYARI
jgi:hypothetical protein